MLTDRDNEIMLLIATFGGKTFNQVLEKTVFNGLSNAFKQAGNRVRKIRDKYDFLTIVPTGIMSPKNAIVLTSKGKEYCFHKFGLEVGEPYMNIITLQHTIFEQISFYWFSKLGNELKRTTVKEWKNAGFKHTPDFYCEDFKGRGKTYFEVETSKKQEKRYLEVFMNTLKDDIKNIVYVFENEKKLTQISKVFPVTQSITVVMTTIDDIVTSCSNGNYPSLKILK